MKANHFRWLNLFVVLAMLLPTASGAGGASPAHPQPPRAPTGNVILTHVATAGGSAQAVAVQGSYVYAGIGVQLLVTDVTVSSQPTPRGKTSLSSGVVRDITIHGSFAYVAATSGMAMVDISNPDSPAVVQPELSVPANGLALSADGLFAYTIGEDKLGILDVSSVFPTLLYSSTYASPTGWEDITVDGNYAYAVGGGELLTLNVTDPFSITQLDRRAIPDVTQSRQLSVYNGYLYVAACEQGVHIFNLSNPSQPAPTGVLNTSGACALGVQAYENTAYVATGTSGLQLFNVTEPASPSWLGGIDTPGRAWSVAAPGNGYAYLADDNALRSIDVSTPSAVRQTGEYVTHGQANQVVAVDNFVYAMDQMVSGGLHTYDVLSPTLPIFQSTLHNETNTATNLAVLDRYAYCAGQFLHALDLSVPAYPSPAGSLELPFTPRQAAAFSAADGKRYVALAAQADGLQVVDVSNPADMTIVGTGISADAQGVTVFESRAYVADGANGLRIFSLADPRAPQLLGVLDTAGYAHAAIVRGGIAYVADGANGLQVVDVSNAAAPFLRGNFNTAGEALDVRILGRYVFVAGASGGLHVIDASSPDELLWDSSYTVPGKVSSLAIADGYVYVAAGDGGLLVYRANYFPAYTVSGRVTDGSAMPVPGVAVFSPGTGYVQHTNAAGEYLFFHMPTGAHQIRPYKAGYDFTPALYTPILSDAPAPNLDFTAASLTYTVTGRVTNSRGQPLAGVTVSDGLGNNATTDETGDYSLSLAAGPHHYRASLGGSTFWPPERFVDVPPGLTEQDFTVPAPVELAAYRYGGLSQIVARQDGLLYMDTGAGLAVLNISRPYTPTLVGKSEPLPGSIESLALNGQYAYVALASAGVGILDLNWPTRPKLVNLLPLAGHTLGVAVNGAYLYASLENGLQIFSLSAPAEPVFVASVPLAGGGPLAVGSGMAYVGIGCDGLATVNVNVPTAPELSTFTPLPGCMQDIALDTGYVYLGLGQNGQSGLHILDRVQPPTLVYSETLPAWGGRLTLDGSFVYYGADGLGFNIYDVSIPFNATRVGHIPLTSAAYDVAVNGNTAYLATGDGLRAIDISDRTSPIEAGIYTESFVEQATGISIQGAYAYVAGYIDGLQVYDITSPHNPIFKGKSSEIAGDIVNGVAVQGQTAYVGSGASGLYILNITDPTQPQLLTTYPTSSISDIAVAGDYAYLTGYTTGLTVIRIANPAEPTLVGSYDAISGTYAVELAGNLAYIVQPALGLRSIDVSNPASPIEAGFYDPPVRANNVFVADGRAYLATDAGLIVLDAADLSAAPLGSFETPAAVHDVRVAGNFAYLATSKGLLAVNISHPERMVAAGFLRSTDAWDSRLALRGNSLYLAHTQAGLLVYDLNGPRPLNVLPAGGVNDAPQTITIKGVNFQPGAQAFLGSNLLGSVTVISSTQITAMVPSGMLPGSYALSVRNPDGDSGFLPFAYSAYLNAPPAISGVTPVQGANDLPVIVDIFGSNFAPAVTLRLSGPQTVAVNRVLYISANHLRAVIRPELATGVYDLAAINPGDLVATLPGAYTVRTAAELDDLYAFDFDVFLRPHFANIGVPNALALSLRRQGGVAPLTNVAVDFYDGDPQAGGALLGRGMAGSISPGGVASTTPVSWTPNRIGLHQIYAVIDPTGQVTENIETNNTIRHAITVYWMPTDTTPPSVTGLSVNQGAHFTDTPLVTLNTLAEDNAGGSGVKSLLFVEYEYIKDQAGWVMTAISGWLPYETAWQDYPWRLTPAPGVHYIQAWAADWNGNIAALPASQPISYLPETVAILTGEIHTFRIHLSAGDPLQVSLASITGDADVYVFAPDGSLAGKSETTGPDNLSVVAPVDGLYQVEVEAVTESTYRLSLSVNGIMLPVSHLPDGRHQPHPRGRVQPASDPGGAPGDDIGLPSPTVGHTIFLPLTVR
ncbi:MAG: carboxypeptidase regulatory-like domain-containing protein [Chloroflexota bacterium]